MPTAMNIYIYYPLNIKKDAVAKGGNNNSQVESPFYKHYKYPPIRKWYIYLAFSTIALKLETAKKKKEAKSKTIEV